MPAPGFRDFGRAGWEGIARGVGNYGYSWSCTPVTDDVTVRYLDFNTQNLNPSNAHNRGHGFQLRCLSGFIALRSLFIALYFVPGFFHHAPRSAKVAARRSIDRSWVSSISFGKKQAGSCPLLR